MRRKPRSASSREPSIVVLISGRGSNLQALLDTHIPARITAVISNRADAAGLDIARKHGIVAQVVAHRDHADRASFDSALSREIDRYQPDFVVLAGFMRILTGEFVSRYHGRLINIHPSLLPAYAGLHTHARALADGVKIHGCTVHFVTSDLDHGPVIIQAAVPVLQNDTVDTLSARVLREEHRVYPQAISWLCSRKVVLTEQNRVQFNLLEQPAPALISPGLE